MSAQVHIPARRESQEKGNRGRSVLAMPEKREVFNSGYEVVGHPLEMEEAPRLIIQVENKGYCDVELTDHHWHNDLGTVEPGQKLTVLAAAIAARSDCFAAELIITVLRAG